MHVPFFRNYLLCDHSFLWMHITYLTNETLSAYFMFIGELNVDLCYAWLGSFSFSYPKYFFLKVEYEIQAC